MNLTDLNEQILIFLEDLNVKDLPRLPNLNGVFSQTDITVAIVSGQKLTNVRDAIEVTFNVSVSATARIPDKENTFDEETNLYQLVQLVIEKLEKKKVRNGGLIRLSTFENFTPDSGKWRSLLSFTVQMSIDFINVCEV